jgi:hypothetical protein
VGIGQYIDAQSSDSSILQFLSEHIVWLYTRYSRAKHRFRDRLQQNGGHSQQYQQQQQDESQGNMLRAQLHELGLDNVSIPITLIAAILLGYMSIG